MVIVKLKGGMGNQMFQYATALGVARRQHSDCLLDTSWFNSRGRMPEFDAFALPYKLEAFSVTARQATASEIARALSPVQPKNKLVRALIRGLSYIRKPKPRVWYEDASQRFEAGLLRATGDLYLDGFWQSENYFHDIASLVRDEFAFRDLKLQKDAREYLKARRRGATPVVCVHVRRGDLAYAYEVLKRPETVHGPPVSAEYVSHAMGQFEQECTFLVFSDTPADIDWCKKHIRGNNVEYSEGHDALNDFAIMRECDHYVISNSTFSWWAAWLNPSPTKRVIAPEKWFNEHYGSGHRLGSLIPTKWTLL